MVIFGGGRCLRERQLPYIGGVHDSMASCRSLPRPSCPLTPPAFPPIVSPRSWAAARPRRSNRARGAAARCFTAERLGARR